ncbi:hypothetical protein M9H77_20524 [Catharanthus roseus]|uniref:Uncharacterized protein n=1 Tax=Catharanthus roseus TaxID=4058 RepID=A0ACC0ANY8_CATRO|nr:hypothetical protein M9H77_20524 [Catharanthus roseus]
MSKVISLCMISLLLLLTLSNNSVAGRPVPAFHDVTPMETLHVEKNEVAKGDTEEGCEGLGEDECMMRRTLQAHLDYIYTQKNQP